jgi:hypothetical protein
MEDEKVLKQRPKHTVKEIIHKSFTEYRENQEAATNKLKKEQRMTSDYLAKQ